jgi:uncharacterized protein (UPF0333 family)
MGGRRKARTRGQSSMEYLIITGISFLFLFAIMVVAYYQSATFSTDVAGAQVQKVGNQIVDAADIAYYAGPPTKKTITVYFPDHIKTITISEQTIIFLMEGNGGAYEYPVFAATNMTGSLGSFKGLHTITITAGNGIVNITDG